MVQWGIRGEQRMEAEITRQEFEVGYARRSGLTLDSLYSLGLAGAPCDCGEEGCEGWQMIHVSELRWTMENIENPLPRERETWAYLQAEGLIH